MPSQTEKICFVVAFFFFFFQNVYVFFRCFKHPSFPSYSTLRQPMFLPISFSCFELCNAPVLLWLDYFFLQTLPFILFSRACLYFALVRSFNSIFILLYGPISTSLFPLSYAIVLSLLYFGLFLQFHCIFLTSPFA